MKALITGIAGFAGSHLAEHLLAAGWDVAGVERHGASRANLAAIADAVRLIECDITISSEIGQALALVRPDTVFHLAAVTFVPSAENAPQTTFDVNVKGTLNVLEGCATSAPGACVILVSSAQVYGKAQPGEMPLTEESPRRPANIYALTKLCAEDIAFFYHRSASLHAVVLRPFNHAGPRQSPAFVTSSFALQIAEIEAGKRSPVLEVGGLDAARDFTDVHDVVRAYRLAADGCYPGQVYNICSGRHYTIREILERLLELTEASIEVRHDPTRMRKSEIPLFYGDSSRLRSATGWQPEYDIDSTLRDTLDYWRQCIRSSSPGAGPHPQG